MNTDVGSAWGVGVLAVLIGLIAVFRGHWSDSLWLALVVYVLFGFLFPPAGVLFGGLVVFYLLFVHGAELANQLGGLVTSLSSQPGGKTS
jgi:hypothetical protein